MMRFQKKENGEVMIESTIIVTFVGLFLTALLFLGFISYQQTLVTVMANQTASNIAQVYSNSKKDPFTGYIDASSLANQKITQKMKDDAYKNAILQKAEWFAKYRLAKYRFLDDAGTTVEADLVSKPNELMKSQIVVTIKANYSIPFFQIFESDGKLSYTATGRADCFDLLDYSTAVNAIVDKDVDVEELTENYTVTYYVDGSVYSTTKVMQNTSIAQSSRHMGSAKMPSDPTYDASMFSKWVMEDGSTVFTKDTVVTSNINVYAEWKCRVDFNGNGGTVNGENPMFVTKGNPIGSFPSVSRGNWTFDGWMLNNSYINAGYVVNSNISLTAHWTCHHKNVTKTVTQDCGHTYYSYRCNDCGATWSDQDNNGKGEHVWVRCGVQTHTSKYGREMKTHSGYGTNLFYKTVQFECIICENCGAYIDRREPDGTSNKIYCMAHWDKNGNVKPCGRADFLQRPVINVHGYTDTFAYVSNGKVRHNKDRFVSRTMKKP